MAARLEDRKPQIGSAAWTEFLLSTTTWRVETLFISSRHGHATYQIPSSRSAWRDVDFDDGCMISFVLDADGWNTRMQNISSGVIFGSICMQSCYLATYQSIQHALMGSKTRSPLIVEHYQ
jgi:hypothetical protein